MEKQAGSRSRWLGLIAILAGIVLGIAFGAAYGRRMWLASGGPEKKLQRLEKTAVQKDRFAQAAEQEGRADEARRLSGQAAVVRAEIAETRQVIAGLNRQELWLAGAAYGIVSFLGEIFLRLLFLMVVPLVFTSMVCGITSLGDIRKLGKIGGWTLTYYMATAAIAVLIGLILVQMIEPGVGTDDTFAYVQEDLLDRPQASAMDTLFDVARGSADKPGSGMIPDNILMAAGTTNVLAVIAFALLFGGALTTLGPKGAPAIDFFAAANDAVMKIVHWIILLAPAGIFGLVATRIADSGGGSAFYEELARLGWFVATVLLGLAIHVVVLCTLLAVLAKTNPLKFIVAVARALLTALSTSSSSATLPVTMECVEETGVSTRSASFVLPLGATINMDGTALYEATAAVFIAQSAGISLGGTALVIVFLTATLAAIGAPGIPNAGLVTMLIVLAAVGLPASGIGTIWAIDWFLDRNRTVVNVFGDAVGAAIIDRHFGEGSG
jgi:Na+/H+-dicarboxylate symporter